MNQLTTLLPEKLKKRFKVFCAEKELTSSDVIKKAFSEYEKNTFSIKDVKPDENYILFSARLDDSERYKIKIEAVKNNVTIASFLQNILEHYLAEENR